MAFDLPTQAGLARDACILSHIEAGDFDQPWATVTSDDHGHHAEFQVSADALKIAGVRVNVTAALQQRIADRLGCLLLTPKLYDMCWAQRAVTLPPFPMPITSSTAAMVEHSAKIDKALALQGNPTGLISTTGKTWVIDEALCAHKGRAENYGWIFEGTSFYGLLGEVVASLMKDAKGVYVRAIQGRGWAHDPSHVDYSQVALFVQRACVVDGQPMDLVQVLQDPYLAPLASHTGRLTIWRQPGVDEEPGGTSVVMPEVLITPGEPDDPPQA